MGVLSHFFLWKLGLAKAWTFYETNELRCLEQYAAGKKRLAEIGCWQGVNTLRLRKAMASGGEIVAVDPYPKGRLGFSASQIIAHREVNKSGNGLVTWLRLTDIEAAKKIQDEKAPLFDFIFSDSHNSYEGAKKTWEAWNPLLSPGGIYIIANTHSTPTRNIESAGSTKYAREVILKEKSFDFLEHVGSFTVMQRKTS